MKEWVDIHYSNIIHLLNPILYLEYTEFLTIFF